MNISARHELIAGSDAKIANYNLRLKELKARILGLYYAITHHFYDENLCPILRADVRKLEAEEEALRDELAEFEAYVEEERERNLP